MVTKRILGLFLLLFLVGGIAACGDDTVDANGTDNAANSGDNQTNNQDENHDRNQDTNGPTGPEDCEDDEIYNPTVGECRPANTNGDNQSNQNNQTNPNNQTNQNNQTNPEECDEGFIWDEDLEECVEEVELECGPGDLVGSACRPDGGNLAGAQILLEGVDCEGEYFSYETTSNSQGEYSFSDIPSGTHEMTISSGSFEGVEEVDIYKGQTQDLTSDSAKVCLQGESVSIAVIQGSFDNIRELLDGMGIPYDVYNSSGENAELLGDLDTLMQYDIVFAECGSTWSSLSSNPFGYDISDIEANIRSFVEQGRSFYGSDWAYQYADIPFGNAFQFSDNTAPSQDIEANVVSDEMQTLLGSTTTNVNFNLGGVYVVEEIGPATEVQFEGPVTMSGDDIDDAKLMSIYYDLVGGGRVVYTSFHNSAQATGNMQDILEFMIFQL